MASPFLCVDVIIRTAAGIVVIKRSNPPFGWALPGGFVDYGESLEQAAAREAREETGLYIKEVKQFHTYSEPGRDPRFHAVSTVFTARAKGTPRAVSDAAGIRCIKPDEIKQLGFAFDHKKILLHYLSSMKIRNVNSKKS
ncbi:MAG: NUDIX hydrolase [Candidatus Omnitrophica bacterium]|nr:NUDIX hydrolase [Candidatus Omnitrophota bacterium]